MNNAGVAVSGPVEYVPIDEWRKQLEINLIGQVAVTQAFLPALRAGGPGGRIVNVSSIGGRIALPLAGPYAASKFALEAVSDSLRRELRAEGMHVSLIEPGGVKTPIWEKGVATANSIEDAMPPEGRERYGPLSRAIRKEVEKIATETGHGPVGGGRRDRARGDGRPARAPATCSAATRSCAGRSPSACRTAGSTR